MKEFNGNIERNHSEIVGLVQSSQSSDVVLYKGAKCRVKVECETNFSLDILSDEPVYCVNGSSKNSWNRNELVFLHEQYRMAASIYRGTQRRGNLVMTIRSVDFSNSPDEGLEENSRKIADIWLKNQGNSQKPKPSCTFKRYTLG